MFHINNIEGAPQAVGTYSQGVMLNGVYYFSGQIGLDPESGVLKEGFKSQLDQILKNIDALLKGNNLTRENIVKSTIFLTNMVDFSMVNEAYTHFFQAPYPARSCVEVSALPKNAVVEIEIIASKHD